MSTDALFDAEPARVDPLTPGQIRRTRVAEAIAHGQHPLAVALRISLPLLAATPARTCGDCRHRELMGGHARDFPKCWWTDDPAGRRHPRITNGAGTDVKKYWPACRDFEAKDGAK